MSADKETFFDNKISKKESENEDNWRSGFPTPATLQSYNGLFENGAYKVFLEIQKISDHKIAMDKLVIPNQLRRKRNGQIFGFVIAICFLIASFILILLGHGIYGTILGSANLIALVTIFVLNKSVSDSLPKRKKRIYDDFEAL